MTPVELERWRRIKAALAAYAYEFDNTSIMSDGEFDDLVKSIDPSVSTVEDRHKGAQRNRYKRLDKFFRETFSPHTGQWIWKHPEFDRVKQLYEWLYKKKKR